jgi:hypothetical protein
MVYTDKYGQSQHKTSTLGWELGVSWADNASSWLPLASVKDSNSIEAAEYAVARDLESEPAFKWWVRKVLRKRDRWVCKVKTRYWKRTHMYGIKLPKSVRQALAIDVAQHNTFWRKAMGCKFRM